MYAYVHLPQVTVILVTFIHNVLQVNISTTIFISRFGANLVYIIYIYILFLKNNINVVLIAVHPHE